jgi:hypothetical protein
MKDDIRYLSDEMLHRLRHQCNDTLQAVWERLENDIALQDGLRRLLVADDMMLEFRKIESESQVNASLILQGAVAVLVNEQSIKAINAELQRRVTELN